MKKSIYQNSSFNFNQEKECVERVNEKFDYIQENNGRINVFNSNGERIMYENVQKEFDKSIEYLINQQIVEENKNFEEDLIFLKHETNFNTLIKYYAEYQEYKTKIMLLLLKYFEE